MCDIVYLGSYRIRKKGEKSNILVLKCIGCVELSKVAMMAFKTITKLRFDVNITPQLGNPRCFFIFSFFLFNFVWCLCKFKIVM